MYAQVEKSKENKSRAVANSVGQKRSNGKQAFGFVDNRPLAATQLKLQERVNNGTQANQLQIMADKIIAEKPLIQGKFIFKNGNELTKRLHLKNIVPNSQRNTSFWVNRVESKNKYLVANEQTLRSNALGRSGEVLSPHRHLIGEDHAQSQFTTALANWGWGADKMAESFNESTEVTDKTTESNQNFKGRLGGLLTTNRYFQTKALENYHPYTIQGLSLTRYWMTQLQTLTTAMENTAAYIAMGLGNLNHRKQQFQQAENTAHNIASNIKTRWTEYVQPNIDSYRDACKNPTPALNGLATLMNPHWGRLTIWPTGMIWGKLWLQIKALGKPDYWSTTSWMKTSTALMNQSTAIHNFINTILDPWVAQLIALSKVDAAHMNGNPNNTIDTSWQNAQAANDEDAALLSIGSMREIFMKDKINSNLNKPGLVQIGRIHVNNLNGQIRDGKYHNSYPDFLAHTQQRGGG